MNKLVRYIIIVFILFGLICTSAGVVLSKQTSVQAAASLSHLDSSNWGYRQKFTINGSPDGAQTNYQMKLTVHKGEGVSNSSDVYLNNHCQSDFDDIRFIRSDSTTPLDYWIARTSPDIATVWVEFDSIPVYPYSADFYIYYGYASASVYSNITSTFGSNYADDFEWGDNGIHLHDYANYGGNAAWSDYLTTTGNPATIVAGNAWQGTRCARLNSPATTACTPTIQSVSLTTDQAVNYMIKVSTTSAPAFLWGNGAKCTYAYCENSTHKLRWYDGTNHDTGYTATIDSWQEWEINDINTSSWTYDWWFQGVKIADDAKFLNNTMNKLSFQETVTGGTHFIDSVIIRKWTDNEPTFSSWGSEEAIGNGELSAIQIGLLSFGLVLMLLGIVVLVKGRAKMLVIGAASAVEKVKRMPMRTKGLIILVAGAIVVIIAIVIIFV